MKRKIISVAGCVFVVVCIALFVYLFSVFQTPDSGQHTGYVTAVEKTGIVFQTWTAYIKTDPQSSQEDTYCVTDSHTISDLQTYEKDRTPVTVYYSTPILLGSWQCAHPASIIHSVSVTN